MYKLKVVILRPARRVDDYSNELKLAGIPDKEIKTIVTNMESLVKGGFALQNLETVVQVIIKDSVFRESFLKDPTSAVKSKALQDDGRIIA